MKLSSFHENEQVLLLGEGNFSFAVSLAKHNLPIAITASSYESSSYHDITRNNVDFLRANGVRVLLGVDATMLAEHPFLKSQSFDKIIFNFPHVGGKMRLDKNRSLLKIFFSSVEQILKPDGLILMTLCNGQGGTLADEPKRRWDDTWKVKEMAAHGNFILSHVEPFENKIFNDYIPMGYRGLAKEFNVQNSLTHYFRKVESPSLEHFAPNVKFNSSNNKHSEENILWNNIFPDNDKCFEKMSPPIFEFDVTFCISDDFCEFYFYQILFNFFGKIVRTVEFVGSYRFPDERITRTYRISYQSDDLPLYRKRIVHIHSYTVSKILEDNLNIIVTR